MDYDPRGKTRIRFSLMPSETSRLVDVRTSPVRDWILALNDFVEAGYEGNVNFGPVILKDGWQDDYARLFSMFAVEIIFLTHSEELHEVNLGRHPKGEEVLWRPDIQEHKTSQASGDRVLRYKKDLERPLVREFRELLAERMPYCRVRYAF